MVALCTGLLLGAGLPACASTGGEGSASSNNRQITQEELAPLSVSTAYDIVERLRPLWLRGSGSRARSTRLVSEIVVLIDGQYFGDYNSLRQIPATGVRELRHMSASEATNAFPLLASGRHVDSAILVYQRTAPR